MPIAMQVVRIQPKVLGDENNYPQPWTDLSNKYQIFHTHEYGNFERHCIVEYFDALNINLQFTV
jgi:hypothetical protein